MLPHAVLQSQAYRTLPYHAMAVCVALAAQYAGHNNGDLALTWRMAPQWGVRSHGQLITGLALLLERGLIQKTRQGGMRPVGPTLYALTWHPIHPREGGYDAGIYPTDLAAHSYLEWSPTGPARGSDDKKSMDPPAVRFGPARGSDNPRHRTRRRSDKADLSDPPVGRLLRSTRSVIPHRRSNGGGT